MEKFFLKQWKITVETWQLALLVVGFVLILITFGALALSAQSHYERANLLEKAALKLANIPADGQAVIEQLVLQEVPDLATDQRFAGEHGLIFDQPLDETGDLILIARFDADRGRSVTEIVDADTGDVLHTYLPDINALKATARDQEAASTYPDPNLDLDRDMRGHEYGLYHPWVDDAGHLLTHDFHTPMFKIDACSAIEWLKYGAYHHAIQRDADGHYWTVKRQVPPQVEAVTPNYEEDAIVKLSADGEVLFERTIHDIVRENDLNFLISMGHEYQSDPYHVNDVEPVWYDGPHWQRGDVFISMRNRSTILLYRPETDQVIWHQAGPWMMQHDVDIVSDHEISAFSNNTRNNAAGMDVLDGVNSVIVFDFDTGEARQPWQAALETLQVSTVTQGLSRVFPDGRLFAEEQDAGRLIMLDKHGNLLWHYINSGNDGRVYNLQWSRYIDGGKARQLRQLIEDGFGCEPDPDDT